MHKACDGLAITNSSPNVCGKIPWNTPAPLLIEPGHGEDSLNRLALLLITAGVNSTYSVVFIAGKNRLTGRLENEAMAAVDPNGIPLEEKYTHHPDSF